MLVDLFNFPFAKFFCSPFLKCMKIFEALDFAVSVQDSPIQNSPIQNSPEKYENEQKNSPIQNSPKNSPKY